MTRLIDISPVLSPKTAVFPGDTAFSRDVLLSMPDGDNLTLSSITTTVHVGAHTDAPNHYRADGSDIGSRSLDLYYGPVQIITVDLPPASRIEPHHVPRQITAPRVLFRTRSMPDPNHFNLDFVSLSPALVHWLADQGVVLVGLDTPSVDPADDEALQSHQAIAERDLAILEGVVLEHVADGDYTLIALPLRLAGADASPVRAVLIASE